MDAQKLVIVTFIKPHFQYAYFAGDTGKVFESQLESLMDGGFVKYYPGDDGEGHDNPLPEDLEARELLFKNGITKLSQIKELGESLTEIKGIGKATLKAILQHAAIKG